MQQKRIKPGEAVAGMTLKGLGFANRSLSLTPQFFAKTPLDLLFRDGIDAEMFNRFQLGRTLGEASANGCDLLCEELAQLVCAHAGIALRFNHLDTTSFALAGDYIFVVLQKTIFQKLKAIELTDKWCLRATNRVRPTRKASAVTARNTEATVRHRGVSDGNHC